MDQEKVAEFHNLVANNFYATKRARHDTCTYIIFLTTRVRAPDEEDWDKLVHLMLYLRDTSKLSLTLSSNGSGILKWWVDASFLFHPNMRGISGGGLYLGRVSPIVISKKQKINTKISTETKIVGVDEFMSAICWTRYFIAAQGYNIRDNRLHQDNKSYIILEKNGKVSNRKRKNHINIRYLFITDRVNNCEVSVVWCPTGYMIGDYTTKPLQGAMFRNFRDQIMGVILAADKVPGKVKV